MRQRTQFLVLCALALIACVQATEITSEMKQENLLLVQMETGYVVDDVLVLLKSFETDIKTQVTDLVENLRIEKEYVTNVIETLRHEKDLKDAECKQHENELENVETEVTKVTEFINWIKTKITSNEAKIEEYNKQSCEKTLEFVEYIRNAHNSLNFIAFLRKGITNYSFAQMKTLASILSRVDMHDSRMTSTETLQTMFLELTAAVQEIDVSQYKAGDSLENKTEARTNDEIGTKHVDNSKDNLDLDHFSNGERKGLEATKQELFKILDLLEKSISNGLNTRIQNQITLSVAYAEYITFLEHENEQLNKELVVQTQLILELQSKQRISQAKSDNCKSEADAIVKKVLETTEQHEKFVTEKENYSKVLENQIEQLEAIIKIYEDKIYTAGSNLKERYDDLLDNKSIDYTASVDDRELTLNYDHLQEADDLEDKVEGQVIATPVDQADEA